MSTVRPVPQSMHLLSHALLVIHHMHSVHVMHARGTVVVHHTELSKLPVIEGRDTLKISNKKLLDKK